LVAGVAAWRQRQRRSNRLQLRLLAGRRRLLGEEVDSRSERLSRLKPEELAADRRAADSVLDGIHMALLDREAHLQNLQDLAHLQQHQLAILRHRHQELSTQIPQQPAPPQVGSDGSIIDQREQLEDRFLETLQQREDTPKPRRRRRRN
jgi:hypothetical protein